MKTNKKDSKTVGVANNKLDATKKKRIIEFCKKYSKEHQQLMDELAK